MARKSPMRRRNASLQKRVQKELDAKEQKADQKPAPERRKANPLTEPLTNLHAQKCWQHSKGGSPGIAAVKGAMAREPGRKRNRRDRKGKAQSLDEIVAEKAKRLDIRDGGDDKNAGAAGEEPGCYADKR